MYVDVMRKKDVYYGNADGRIGIAAINENGKVKLYAWDNQTEKNVKASKYASCKKGTGAYKDYYIVTLKNVPIMNRISIYDGECVTTENPINAGAFICGEGNKTSGTLYFDNVTVTSGSKKVVHYNFSSSKPKFIDVYNKDRKLGSKDVKIVKF